MTQSEKDLLIKDLCSRLPYGVKVQISIWDYNDKMTTEEDATLYTVNMDGYCETVEYDAEISVEEITPYLFPMSSMTEEQKEELNEITDLDIDIAISNIKNDTPNYFTGRNRLNWLLKNHFDIYDLIPMGLAEDATGLNIY